jgi:Zn-dependent metalloprotease
MKRYTCLILTLIMMVSAVALSLSGVSAQQNGDQGSQDPSRPQSPQRVAVQQNIDQDALPEDLALAKTISYLHLAEHIGGHGIADLNELKTLRVEKDEQSLTHTHVQQTLRGVPVFGGEAIVHLNPDSTLSDITDNFISYVRVETEPTITAKEAITIAVSQYGCGECLTATPEVDLWVLRRNGRDRLVYRVQMRREDGSADTAMPVYFIDAHTGSKVWSYDNLQSSGAVTGTGNSLYSGTRSITTYYKSVSPYIGYYLEDITRKVGTYDNAHTDNTTYLFNDADNVWNGSYQAIGVDAHFGAEKFIDYLKIKHGRSGLNGSGGPAWYTSMDGVTGLISLKVHVGVNLNKGYWNGQYVSFGDGDGTVYGPTATLDFVGHEMQHGVTQFTANLINSGESGALNESWSDVFGAMLERYVKGESADTWKIFEQCWTPQIAGDAERYMDTPHSASNKGLTADDDPDHYDERYLGTADNGGIHVNSGIPNKVFYLVAKGGTHHRGGSMTGIGADAAEKIWYKALTSYMTSNTTFAGARVATLNAAAALYGLGSIQYNAVGQAWTLCGVPGANPPPAPSLSVNNVTVTEANTGVTTTATFTVTLSPASTQTVTVKYATANSTALAPADYTALPLTTLTFAPGQTSKPVAVQVKGDALDEANETFKLLLSSPVNALISDNEGLCTITDNDLAPSLRVNSLTVAEANTGANTTAAFNITLSAVSGQTVKVNYATANGTAVAPADYTAKALTTLTFLPGQTTQTIPVVVRGDALDEVNETFKLVLSSPVNATIAVGTGTATITDNDLPPSIRVNNVAVTEGNAAVVTNFTVSLSAPSGQVVTVKYATANGTATTPADYGAKALTTLTFLPGAISKTVAVSVAGDLLDEPSENFKLLLSSPVHATIAVATGICTITDNDAPPSVTITNATVTEPDSGVVIATFTVKLSAASGQTVSIKYATANGTSSPATAGTDYTAVPLTTLTFLPGQTTKAVTVQVKGDLIKEMNETFFVNLSGVVNATLADAQGLGTILNDD